MSEYQTKTEFQGKKLLNATFKGEEPKTNFVESYKAPRVELLATMDPTVLYRCMFTFIMGSYGNHPHKVEEYNPTLSEMEEVIEACLNHEALPLAMEIPTFTFKIYGIDRIITHQIVRSRIGVTFSQHCTGDNDVRHVDYLLPYRMLAASEDKGGSTEAEFVQRVQRHLKEAKELYVEAIDEYNYSIQDARHILPQCLDTYIYMHCNYMMLRNFVARRLCANETPQMQWICKGIKEEVSRAFPLLGKYLVGSCDITGRCNFRKNNSVFGGSVYFGCGKYPRRGLKGNELSNDPDAYIHPGYPSEYRGIVTEGEKDIWNRVE